MAEDDARQLLQGEELPADLPADAAIPLELWSSLEPAKRKQLLDAAGKPGLAIQTSGEITAAEFLEGLGGEEVLSQLALVQVDIPQLKDGRCFSLAARIKGQHKFSGELRAVGSYLPDQIYFLARCGFDSFALPSKVLQDFGDADTLRQILKPFSAAYQHSRDGMATVIDKRFTDTK